MWTLVKTQNSNGTKINVNADKFSLTLTIRDGGYDMDAKLSETGIILTINYDGIDCLKFSNSAVDIFGTPRQAALVLFNVGSTLLNFHKSTVEIYFREKSNLNSLIFSGPTQIEWVGNTSERWLEIQSYLLKFDKFNATT